MLDIGEVVKRSGLAASTLRFYEQKGLIKPLGRNGLRRIFEDSVLDRLSLILLGQSAGFSLDEISAMFTTNGVEIDRNLLLSKAEQLDKTIKKLQTMSKGLRHAARCPAANHFECPKFQRILKMAAKNPNKKPSNKRLKKAIL